MRSDKQNKGTIDKVLKEDTTLREGFRTLFREEGIKIVSVLTAIGMIIGVIVEAVIPSGTTSCSTPPKSSSQSLLKIGYKISCIILVNFLLM